MNLKELTNNIELQNELPCDILHFDIKGISDNSSKINPGDLFVAIKGYQKDGHDFIDEAIKAGAIAIMGESEISQIPVPYIQVKNTRKSLGILASNYYGNPSKNKIMIGITGTNGKTTISYLIKHFFEEHGSSCSVIGTNQNIINGEVLLACQTTPNALELNKLLHRSNDTIAIIEVSSHGLSQYRIEGIKFDYCLFTNLGHDHLDYHVTMEEYFLTKQSLFDKLKTNGIAIINSDDIWGQKLLETLKAKGHSRIASVGKESSNTVSILETRVSDTSTMLVKQETEVFKIYMPLPGLHNLYNAVMAYLTANMIGMKRENIIKAISEFPGVSGRFEKLTLRNGVTAIIDYAHTPEAILYCLEAIRYCGAKRVIHVFGFRGNRDASKREEMIQISSELSDIYMLTFDDLNTVPPEEMVKILCNLQATYGKENGRVIPDRTEAIKLAVTSAKKGDWIVVTGKGHETYQQTYHFKSSCDRETFLLLS
ncbi:UDP-N-acetylmuramoyl-L-alanyl-D-glutamate--2,6-diaminopimelate ligase [Fredinandcohnia humi]